MVSLFHDMLISLINFLFHNIALGTLYAFQKAVDLAKSSFSFDITSKLKNGEISVGLFHTAGKGTRLGMLISFLRYF